MNSLTTPPRTESLEARAQRVLLGWRLGLVTSDEVFAWTDARVLEAQSPGSLPTWFLTLAAHGPDKCFKLSGRDLEFEWPPVRFHEEFLSEVYLVVRRKRKLVEFVEWLSRVAMGEDLDDIAVCLGYEMEHLICDCDRTSDAVAEAERRLPKFAPAAEEFVASIRTDVDA